MPAPEQPSCPCHAKACRQPQDSQSPHAGLWRVGVLNLRRHFGTVFRRWRREAGISQKQVSIETGYSDATISAWEIGERVPEGEALSDIMAYTGVKPCRFLCGWMGACLPSYCRHADQDGCGGK